MEYQTRSIVTIAVFLGIIASMAFLLNNIGDGVTSAYTTNIKDCESKCSLNQDCNDDNPCTIDRCIDADSCSSYCLYEDVKECASGDKCCPIGCAGKDSDC